jgi:hypothetical protein
VSRSVSRTWRQRDRSAGHRRADIGEYLAAISPYLIDHIMRFGEIATAELTVGPEAFDPCLEVAFDAEEPEPTAA